MGHIHSRVRIGTVLVLCMLAFASMYPLSADARGDRSGRADVIERLCDRQDWLGSRLHHPIIDPDICNPPPPPEEPTLAFTATPASITEGESAALEWDSEHATSCVASGSWSGVKTADGSESVSPSENAVYSLECTGPGGAVSASVDVTVTPAPELPTITLMKTVVNDDEGTATADDFQAKIDGVDVPWSVAQTVSAGAHTVSEVTAAGYTAGSWGGDCAADGTITVALGENKTCTITNDDNEPAPPVAPKLTVTKVVVNDDGGTKAVADFVIMIDGQPVVSGAEQTLTAGMHTVSETADAGYAMTVSGDCAADGTISLAAGDVKSCTITNDDIAPELDTITEIVVADDRFDTLEAAVIAAALDDDLAGVGPFTVFAPTDEAFAALPDGVLAGLLADIPALTDVLLYHVVSGKNLAAAVAAADTLMALLGETVDITVNDDGVFVNDAEIIATDIEASNGVIHVIDAVLIPPQEQNGELLISEVLYDLGAGQGSESGNEWVEIYNGTGAEVDLSGYAIHDAAGSDALPEGTILAAGGFLIVTGTSTTASFWTIPEGTVVISLGSNIGSNGLGNTGDRVELRNAEGSLVDNVSWGSDESAFSPSVALVDAGHSLSRASLATDTDTAADWTDNAAPNPGS